MFARRATDFPPDKNYMHIKSAPDIEFHGKDKMRFGGGRVRAMEFEFLEKEKWKMGMNFKAQDAIKDPSLDGCHKKV